MTEREQLIKELSKLGAKSVGYGYFDYVGVLADFIISDRKRIVEPLVDFRNNVHKYGGLIAWIRLDNKEREAIEKTLLNAGIGESSAY